MFLAYSAKPIDDSLKNLVDKIEAQNPGLSVLAARQFRYHLHQNLVEVTIKQPRKFNVLEEFIIRAGIEFDPPPTADELASVLGLDPVFVKSTIATLQTLQTLAVKSPITVTPEGRLFYEKGSVPQPPYTVQLYAIANPLLENITFQSEPLNDVVNNLPDLGDFVNLNHKIIDISDLPLEEIQQSLQASALALHVPDEGKIVTSCRVVAATQKIWKNISLFVLFNAHDDKLSIQVRNGKQILKSASNWLEMLQAESKISLQSLCEVSNQAIIFEREATFKQKNTEIENRLASIRQKALEIATQSSPESDNSTVLGTVVQLRDGEIAQTFWEILNLAKRQIIIYSPWLSQAVVDEKFLTLLQKLINSGVWILIGYGISQRQEDEEQLIPPEVEEKLRSLKTPNGLPALQIFWLGDSHVKEIIVDREIYLCGSHHWLSDRGDYLPEGELVYKVTIPHQIQEAYEFLAYRFNNHAQKLWDNALENRDSKLAVESLCVWGALGMEEIALTAIQQNNWFELLPVWLNVVLQGLKSKNLPDDSATFKTALSLLNQISSEDTFIESLQQGWRQVIGAIATHNHQAAIKLISDEVWQEFLRLGITQPPLNTPEQFIAEYITSQNTPKPPQSRKAKTSKAKK